MNLPPLPSAEKTGIYLDNATTPHSGKTTGPEFSAHFDQAIASSQLLENPPLQSQDAKEHSAPAPQSSCHQPESSKSAAAQAPVESSSVGGPSAVDANVACAEDNTAFSQLANNDPAQPMDPQTESATPNPQVPPMGRGIKIATNAVSPKLMTAQIVLSEGTSSPDQAGEEIPAEQKTIFGFSTDAPNGSTDAPKKKETSPALPDSTLSQPVVVPDQTPILWQPPAAPLVENMVSAKVGVSTSVTAPAPTTSQPTSAGNSSTPQKATESNAQPLDFAASKKGGNPAPVQSRATEPAPSKGGFVVPEQLSEAPSEQKALPDNALKTFLALAQPALSAMPPAPTATPTLSALPASPASPALSDFTPSQPVMVKSQGSILWQPSAAPLVENMVGAKVSVSTSVTAPTPTASQPMLEWSSPEPMPQEATESNARPFDFAAFKKDGAPAPVQSRATEPAQAKGGFAVADQRSTAHSEQAALPDKVMETLPASAPLASSAVPSAPTALPTSPALPDSTPSQPVLVSAPGSILWQPSAAPLVENMVGAKVLTSVPMPTKSQPKSAEGSPEPVTQKTAESNGQSFDFAAFKKDGAPAPVQGRATEPASAKDEFAVSDQRSAAPSEQKALPDKAETVVASVPTDSSAVPSAPLAPSSPTATPAPLPSPTKTETPDSKTALPKVELVGKTKFSATPSSAPVKDDSVGTAVASSSSQMLNAHEQNDFAARSEQYLPDASAVSRNTEKTTGTKALHSDMTVQAEAAFQFQTRSGEHVTNQASSSSLVTDHARTAEKLFNSITQEVTLMRQVASDKLDVVLRPDADTQISLQLRVRNGVVEGTAHCERGDFQLLNAHWTELQRSFDQKGIHLAPLRDSDLGLNYSGGSFGGSARQDQRERKLEQTTVSEPFLVSKTNAKTRPVSADERTGQTLLQTWA